MSTAFRFKPTVSNEKFLAAAAKLGYRPIPNPETTDKQYFIGNESKSADHGFGAHLLACWAYVDDDGTVSFERFGLGSGDHLYEIADALGVECLSEHDEEFFTGLTPSERADELFEPDNMAARDEHAAGLYADDQDAMAEFKEEWDRFQRDHDLNKEEGSSC